MAVNVTPNSQASTHTSYGSEANSSSLWSSVNGTYSYVWSNSGVDVYQGSYFIAQRRASADSYNGYRVALASTIPVSDQMTIWFAKMFTNGEPDINVEVRCNSVSGQLIGTYSGHWVPTKYSAFSQSLVVTSPVSYIYFKLSGGPSGYTYHHVDAMYVTHLTPNATPSEPTNILLNGADPSAFIPVVNPSVSAQFNDPDGSGEYARYYQVQVSTDATFNTVTHRDSTKTQLAEYSPGCPEGSQCDAIAYGGSGLGEGVRYWVPMIFLFLQVILMMVRGLM